MNDGIAVVVTSIAAPNPVLRALARGSDDRGHLFIVIGDKKSPPDFHLDGCRFYNLEEQYETGFSLAELCPTGHYARKNLGYLAAIREGVSVIVETDDDNLPYPQFWDLRHRHPSAPTLADGGWVNVYSYFSDANIWPRGLPLDRVQDGVPQFDSLATQVVDCPIQQGLADQNPDVDAVYRLVLPLPQCFRRDRRIALTSGSWCPFNSQNTTWWADAFPLLYLPSFCSFRMTDIWRSFVAQRIAWVNSWGILFHEPTVSQERNEHNLMRDFADEVPGYLHNAAICEALGKLPLVAGTDKIGDNLLVCYEELVRMELIPPKELELVQAWLADLSQIDAGLDVTTALAGE